MPSCTATILSYMKKKVKVGIRPRHVCCVALSYVGNTVHSLKGSVSTCTFVCLKLWLLHLRTI